MQARDVGKIQTTAKLTSTRYYSIGNTTILQNMGQDTLVTMLLPHTTTATTNIDRRIYLNHSKSIQSAAGQQLLDIQIITLLFTFTVQKYIYCSVII